MVKQQVLICFDFDYTLVKGHYHSELMGNIGHYLKGPVHPNTDQNGVQILQPDGSFMRRTLDNTNLKVTNTKGASQEHIATLLKAIGPKSATEMAHAFKRAINNGHKIAITSFTLYPEVIVPTMRLIFGADAETYIKEICVVGGFPHHGAGDLRSGKQEHIQAAQQYFRERGVEIANENTMLVDDTRNNILIAKEHGLKTVLVDSTSEEISQENFEAINRFTAHKVPGNAKSPSTDSKANQPRKTI